MILSTKKLNGQRHISYKTTANNALAKWRLTELVHQHQEIIFSFGFT